MGTNETSSNNYGKFQWFFFIVLIPAIFSIILIAVILTFLGVNVAEKAQEVGKQVPYLSDYLAEDEADKEQAEGPSIEELKDEIASQQSELEKAEQLSASKDEEIRLLQEQLMKLEAQLSVANVESEARKQELSEIGKIYEGMSSKNAANILVELPSEEAITHLMQISTDKRAEIFAKMTPEQAATFLLELTNQ